WSRDPWKNRRSDSPRCCETRASCAGEPMKGVLIIAEHLEGRLAPSTPELITTGRSLAAALGGAARIAVLGSGVQELADRLAGYTLDVLLAEHPALAEYTGDGYVRAVRGMMTVTAVPVVIEPSAIRETFLRLERPQVQDIDLSGADIIVSAGRGIQKKENLVLIEEFAKAIGGVVGASRPLTDMDWLPKTRQVGQSGKTVRPKLYVACGISGAMQHV